MVKDECFVFLVVYDQTNRIKQHKIIANTKLKDLLLKNWGVIFVALDETEVINIGLGYKGFRALQLGVWILRHEKLSTIVDVFFCITKNSSESGRMELKSSGADGSLNWIICLLIRNRYFWLAVLW